MKLIRLTVALCLIPLCCTAQAVQSYENCRTNDCRIVTSYALAKEYLEADQIDMAQKWLNVTMKHHNPFKADSVACHIHSLQSELFYYLGLFQFGAHEAKKGIEKAQQINDSLLIADAYFFLGINRFELEQFDSAQEALWKSRRWFPKNARNRMAYTIEEEHIDNNIAQLKLKINQPDSAIWYNTQAYKFAKIKNSRRGIPNVEQTFGEIYLHKNLPDSAAYYFEKSSISAQNSEYYDIVLIDYALLMNASLNDPQKVMQYYHKGEQLMREKTVNLFFIRYFYELALKAFREFDSGKMVMEIQEKIIKMDEKTRITGNKYLQDITQQYIKNENQLLLFEVDNFRKQRNFTISLIVLAMLCILILALTVRILRNRNKLQKTLLHQKNEISKDLHDDIGSGLSSIMIYADLLTKNKSADESQGRLAAKIAITGKEISQKLHTFIWSLNNDNNTLQHFCEYVKVYGTNLFEATGISFSFSKTEESLESKTLDGQYRKNLFFCVKELLNNALKHARAAEVKIFVNVTKNNLLQITVSDNGTGIQKENTFGNGIRNIQKRIENLKGTVKSKNHNGLSTTITVPLSTGKS